ncbi:MAG: DUF1573 domain-containing protein [Thermodesulfobacteriota bacterium]
MKWKRYGVTLAVVTAGVMITAWACKEKEAPTTPAPGEKMSFYFGMPVQPVYSKSVVEGHESAYDFPPALQFDLVRHDFVIKNTTAEPLELRKVESCCGSLVENYSRQIPPGQEGVISIVLLTDRRGGTEIKGVVHAVTNHKTHPDLTIHISCPVKKFADISVHKIMLDGSCSQDVAGDSVVIPAPEYPFTITGIKAKKGLDIAYAYAEVETEGRKGYRITARSIRKTGGPIRDTLYIQTDNPARPEFIIRVQGKISGC